MKSKHRRAHGPSFFAIVFALGFSASAPAQTYDFTAVTNQLQNNLALYGSNVVAIVEQEQLGEVYRFQAGTLTQGTRLPIASCTKWISGAIVLICAQRGYFQLDDRIGDYLPIFDTYGKGDLTIRQCFGMKSGLSLGNPEYERDSTLTLAQSVELIAANTPVAFTPGTMLDYQGDGMQTVGRICEVVTGKSWGTLAREVLFDPLGMSTADYALYGINPNISGGARCSATDYLKFLRMIMNSGQGENGAVILSSRSVQEFFTNQTNGLPEYYSPWPNSVWYRYAQRPDYGMGAWVMAQHPVTGVVEEIGSAGAFGTYPWVDRRRGLRGIIFMFANNGFASTYNNNLYLQKLIRDEIDAKGLPPIGPASEIAVSRADNYLRLAWTGGGTLETSADLSAWTALPWARPPFLESLASPPASALFYRVRW